MTTCSSLVNVRVCVRTEKVDHDLPHGRLAHAPVESLSAAARRRVHRPRPTMSSFSSFICGSGCRYQRRLRKGKVGIRCRLPAEEGKKKKNRPGRRFVVDLCPQLGVTFQRRVRNALAELTAVTPLAGSFWQAYGALRESDRCPFRV